MTDFSVPSGKAAAESLKGSAWGHSGTSTACTDRRDGAPQHENETRPRVRGWPQQSNLSDITDVGRGNSPQGDNHVYAHAAPLRLAPSRPRRGPGQRIGRAA